jgi:hypothetical protein
MRKQEKTNAMNNATDEIQKDLYNKDDPDSEVESAKGLKKKAGGIS